MNGCVRRGRFLRHRPSGPGAAGTTASAPSLPIRLASGSTRPRGSQRLAGLVLLSFALLSRAAPGEGQLPVGSSSGGLPPEPEALWRANARLPAGSVYELPKGTLRTGWYAGYGKGPAWFGSTEPHDLLLTSFQVGWMASGELAPNRFWRGNVELLTELQAAWQHHPRDAYLVGLIPVVRYNFATHSRWTPFVEFGSGLALTDIGRPDLGSRFQFQSLVGLGVHHRLSPELALSFETRLAHVSNADMARPNHGVNEFEFLVGVSWFHLPAPHPRFRKEAMARVH